MTMTMITTMTMTKTMTKTMTMITITITLNIKICDGHPVMALWCRVFSQNQTHGNSFHYEKVGIVCFMSGDQRWKPRTILKT